MKKMSSQNKPNARKRLEKFAVVSLLAIAVTPTSQAQSVWTGATGTWSGNGNPGWNDTGVPTAGTTANVGSTAKTITLDVAGTAGSVIMGGSSNATTILTLTNGLTLNNNGSGSILSNENSSTGSNNRLSLNGGVLTLGDNLLISNTGGSTNATGSILFASSATISGNGNLSFFNVSNSTAAIGIQGVMNFSGTVFVQKGLVNYSTSSSFGNASNTIVLGSSGNGAASLVGTASGSPSTLANSIVVAAGSSGTLLLGNNGAGANDSTFSGSLTLNGDISLISMKPGNNVVRYTNVISGVGAVTTVGTGKTQFGDGSASITNTFEGNTTLTETSSLVLADNAKMTFYIEGSGVNNKITSTGGNNNVLTLNGDFIFDLTAASTVVGASWSIVDVSLVNETFASTFTVVDFLADVGGVLWTKDINGTSYYQFSEATGVLSVVPEPGTFALAGLGLAMFLFRRRKH